MTEWWRFLRGKPFYWALDGTHPAADLVMLRDVIERPDSARPLRSAELSLKESAPVVAALEQLLGASSLWERYDGLAWRLRLLAELTVPGDDERIATALDRVLDAPLPPGLPAASPLLVQIGGSFGFGQDERVRRLADEMISDSGGDDVPYLVLALQALSVLSDPPPGSIDRLEAALSGLLPDTLPDPGEFGHPTYDEPDALTLSLSALRAGIRGSWLRPWVRVVEEAQDEEGLWRMAIRRPTPGVPAFEDETEGAPSRLISARALYVLREWHGE